MMKRIVAWLFFLVIAVAALALIAPNFIDWNKHKDVLIARIGNYIQRDITVAGEVTFRVLPNPQILMRDVTIASVKDAQVPALLKLRELDAKVLLMPLLEGRIEVESFNLTEPELTLEVLADGTVSWAGVLRDKETQNVSPAGLAPASSAVKLENLTVTNGRVRYLHQASGADVSFENLNLSISADTLQGPYQIKGAMRYRDVPVNVEIKTAAAKAGQPASVDILLQPTETLPQMRFAGGITLKTGLAMEGDLTLLQGAPASLFDNPFFAGVSFMNESADVAARLSVKSGAISLTDIDAKIGKGQVTGTLDVTLARDQKPKMQAKLAVSSVTIADKKAGYLPVPPAFDVSLDLDGKDVVWQGVSLPVVKMAVHSENAEWVVPAASVTLPGKGRAEVSGSVTPLQKLASWKVKLRADDAGRMLSALNLPEDNIFKVFAVKDTGQSLSLTGNVDMRTDKTSLYNFDADLRDAGKASGVINFFSGKTQARLNLSGVDVATFPQALRDKAMAHALRHNIDIEVDGTDIRYGSVIMPKLALKAVSTKDVLNIKSVNANFTEGGGFMLAGKITGWDSKVRDFDLGYTLETDKPQDKAEAFALTLPVPLNANRALNIKGDWASDKGNLTVAAKGAFGNGDITLETASAASTDALPRIWQGKVVLNQPDSNNIFGLFDLPLDKLLLPAGKARLVSELMGNEDGYALSGLRASVGKESVTGQVMPRADGVLQAEFKSSRADFDRWFAGNWPVRKNISMVLTADHALWRDQSFRDVSTDMMVLADGLEVKNFNGKFWDGSVSAAGRAHLKSGKWQGSLKGTMRAVNLAHLVSLIGLDSVAVTTGDVTFDLKGQDDPSAKMFHNVAGDIALTIEQLTLDGFDPGALVEYAEAQKSVPKDLGVQLHQVLRNNGAAVYEDVSMDVVLADGKMTIANLSLENADSNVQVTGGLDIGPATYDIKAQMTLKNVPDVGGIQLTRAGDVAKAPDYRMDTKGIEAWIASRMPAPVEETPVAEMLPAEESVIGVPLADPYEITTPDGEANATQATVDDVEVERLPAPPVDETEASETEGPSVTDAISGILNRLDDEGAQTAPDPEMGTEETDILPAE